MFHGVLRLVAEHDFAVVVDFHSCSSFTAFQVQTHELKKAASAVKSEGAAIDAMNRVMKQPAASTVVALGLTLPRLLRPALLQLLQPLPHLKATLLAAAANAFVFLKTSVMKHGFIAEHATVLCGGFGAASSQEHFCWRNCSQQLQ